MESFAISYNLLKYFSLFIAIFGIYHWQLLPKHLLILVTLRLLTFSADLVGEITSHINDASLFSSIVEMVSLFTIYHLITKNQHTRKIYIVIMIFLILFDLSFWIYDGGQSKSIYILAINTAFLLALCLYYFYDILKLSASSMLSEPMFWVNTSFVIKLSGSLILYIFNDYLYTILGSDLIFLWTFRNLLAIVAYGLIFYALWLGVKESKLKAA